MKRSDGSDKGNRPNAKNRFDFAEKVEYTRANMHRPLWFEIRFYFLFVIVRPMVRNLEEFTREKSMHDRAEKDDRRDDIKRLNGYPMAQNSANTL